jgi:hypothetical protein
MERMKSLNINSVGFLLPEEEKLFSHIMKLNEDALAFEDNDRARLRHTSSKFQSSSSSDKLSSPNSSDTSDLDSE